MAAAARSIASIAKARALVGESLKNINPAMKKILHTTNPRLQDASTYYVDDKGKMFRPMLVLLMAHTCSPATPINPAQESIATIAELIHTASLMHDDVIDQAALRRSKPSINAKYGDEWSVLAGDFVLSRTARALAAIGNIKVIEIMSQVIEDLVRGELRQLGSSSTEERMGHYIDKTYLKTASLIACSCNAVSALSPAPPSLHHHAFQYGRHVGLAFQILDDILDANSSTQEMGKETAVDMKLGIATAPVIYACEEYPELDAIINRKFGRAGDVQRACALVQCSQGLKRARDLAEMHTMKAVEALQGFEDTSYRKALEEVALGMLSRQH